jgi:hypothetical protein
MGRPSLTRTTAAVLAGAALFLTSAGACGGGEGEDEGDDRPGVTQQEGGEDEEGGGDEGGGGQGGGEEGAGEEGGDDEGGEGGDD